MKKIILFLLFCTTPAFADFLDEQDLYTADKTCKIHYLTPKPKNLWSIELDQTYCKDGSVHGFTTVTLKDSLNRTIETLHGFFHQGYWLTNFTNIIQQFYRISPDEGIQDFIYSTGQDPDLHLTYYLVARAKKIDEHHYSAFTSCPDVPILLVAHEPTADFKQSLFQNAVLKQAQVHLSHLCPDAKGIQIFATSLNKIDTDSAVFQADINFEAESVTMSYREPIDKSVIPKPTELRHEHAENILTIRPDGQNKVEIPSDSVPVSKEKTKSTRATVPHIKSAVDLALIAQLTGNKIDGQAIVYVDHMDDNQRAVTTLPTSLLLNGKTALSSGWYLIDGAFSYEDDRIVVQLTSAKSCQKEWCLDEN